MRESKNVRSDQIQNSSYQSPKSISIRYQNSWKFFQEREFFLSIFFWKIKCTSKISKNVIQFLEILENSNIFKNSKILEIWDTFRIRCDPSRSEQSRSNPSQPDPSRVFQYFRILVHLLEVTFAFKSNFHSQCSVQKLFSRILLPNIFAFLIINLSRICTCDRA